MVEPHEHIRTPPPGSKPAAGRGKRLCVLALTDGHAGLLALGQYLATSDRRYCEEALTRLDNAVARARSAKDVT